MHRYRVGRPASVTYGPGSSDGDDWELRFSTIGGERIVAELAREQMYELWIEVKGVPWPKSVDDYRRRDDLLGELVERANMACNEQLRDALTAIGGETQ
ncbi:hypothetical protein HUG12_10955 [Halorarum salinum]|uniref:Uncharacterized protein n=1 Tax=Halorarum salinum TaxID=2743089 RepID=A0A7D5QJY0_9EURY|nr:hypothetical protein HUG12_10955 [Halobaculum salinum]